MKSIKSLVAIFGIVLSSCVPLTPSPAFANAQDIENAYQRIERYRAMKNATTELPGEISVAASPCMIKATSKHYINANQVKYVRTKSRIGIKGLGGVEWVFDNRTVVILPTSNPQADLQRYLNEVRNKCQ